MRLIHIAPLTLALAASLASPADADDQSSRWIRVQQLPLAGSMNQPAQAGGKEKWIEIQGWDWEVEASDNLYSFKVGGGATPADAVGASANKVDIVTVPPITGDSAAKVDSFTMKQRHRKVRPVGTSDLTMKRGTSPGGPAPQPVPRPDLDLDYDEGDTGTHAASRRGTSESITIGGGRTESRAAPDKYGRVKVKFAWEECKEGTRLPLVELRDARMLYRLEDVTVAGCSTSGATLRYRRITRSPAT